MESSAWSMSYYAHERRTIIYIKEQMYIILQK